MKDIKRLLYTSIIKIPFQPFPSLYPLLEICWVLMYTLFVTFDLDWSHIGIDQLMELALILYSAMNQSLSCV